ncbi:MAG: oxaloacetate-decarboxylating malate dehydrogenase, partial [Roseovarius sp.]|nr:oxaloacetate-decarboxylating malate dehydrogenase [Roseovarius sp.]
PPDDKGDFREMLDNWPEDDVKVIVATDGQRILGLGDLGANGMGIPIGKVALYTACAGIPPHQCLPVMLDVGTNNEELLSDPLYLGYPHKRLEGRAYLDLVDEFVVAIQDKFPGVLLQFEDFLTPNAYRLLDIYRDRILCFNDDIQGTAAVALSGVIASNRITGTSFADLRIMFLGAGSAATGIGDLMLAAFIEEGLSEAEALKRLWFVDIDGLIVASRDDLLSHNIPYAHDHEQLGFVEAIEAIRPHILIGATGAPGTFTKEVIEAMARINDRPAIFALSNPTSRAECSAAQAYEWSNGKAIFTSGSPFHAVELDGKIHQPGQGNNAYVFPGIGLGALACGAGSIGDGMFLAAADALAHEVSQQRLDAGTLYPPLSDIRNISLNIAVAVAEKAFETGVAQAEQPQDVASHIQAKMYESDY